jgi:O-methyltransferase/methyltransferase family protein
MAEKAQISTDSQANGQELRDLLMGFVVSRALQVAAELELADALADGPKDCAYLAETLRVQPAMIFRLLRALASRGVFEERPDGRFANTAISDCLRRNAPKSLHGLALMYGDAPMWRAWEALLHSLRTGEPAFWHVHGVRPWDFLAAHEASARRFDDAMLSSSGIVNEAIVAAYDWKGLGTLVDVAGGAGGTIAALLEATPTLTGVLFDLPHVIERAREYLIQRGVAARCKTVAGSFFDAVPAGADAYFMKHIIHDWSDQDCLRILSNCRAAMGDHARLIICERVIPTGNEPHYGKLVDLVMLVMTQGGRERTETEYRELLRAAGFRLARIVATQSEFCLLEAVKA